MPDVETPIAPGEGVVEPTAPPTVTDPEEIQTPPVEGQPVTETPSEPEQSEQPEEEVDLDATPETSGDFSKYKDLFKTNPELRAIVGREAAFSEISPNGSFQELKSIVERVPSLEDAERLATDAQSHRELGETFRRDPVAFTESLRENDPLAFSQFAKKLPEILAETDTNLYREQASFYTNAVLDNLFSRYRGSDNQDAIMSLQNVAAMLGVQLGMPRMQPSQDTSEVAKLRKQLQERDQAETSAKAETFWKATVDEHENTSLAEIESLIKKSNPTVTEAQLKRMKLEVWEGVNTRLGSQPQTMSQLNAFQAAVGKGKMGAADHKAIVDFAMRRTRQLIPMVWKDVSSEWTKQVLAHNKQQIESKKGIAATSRDVPAPTGASPVAAPPKAPGAKRNMKDIFNSLRTGTYQAPASARR